MTVTITAAEIDEGLAILSSTSLGAAIAAAQTALASGLGDVKTDAVVVEDVLTALSAIPGLAALGDVSAAIKILMLVNSLSAPPENGGVLGAFADSLAGVTRPVADADGSQL